MKFCSGYDFTPFPLSEPILCRFVAYLVTTGLSFQSIRQYLSALRYYQLSTGGPDPSFASLFQLHYVLRGVQRSHPLYTRPKRLPITPAVLRLLYHQWSHVHGDFNSACLWAASCLGFFAFMRSGEFTCQSWSTYHSSMLSLGDIEVYSRTNSSVMHVTLRRSKTDIVGVVITIHIGRTHNLLCPVSAVLAYLSIRPATPGPLFLLQSGMPLSRHYLVTAIRRALSLEGMDTAQFHGHSFRIGAATTAAQVGLPDSTIQLLGRWRSSVFTRYLRPPVQSLAVVSGQLAQAV